jgi:hypothetical protein
LISCGCSRRWLGASAATRARHAASTPGGDVVEQVPGRADGLDRAEFERFTPKVRFHAESYDVAQALVGTCIGVTLVSRLARTGVPGTTHRELAQPRPHPQLHAVTQADTTLTLLVDAFAEAPPRCRG